MLEAWNPATQAFQKAKTPEAYDHVGQVYVPSHGAAYDSEAQAWKDAWSPKLYLYNYGDECTAVTGGIRVDMNFDENKINYNQWVSKRSDCIHVAYNDVTANMGGITANKIDITGYTKICTLRRIIKRVEDSGNFGYQYVGAIEGATSSPYSSVDSTTYKAIITVIVDGEEKEYHKGIYHTIPLNKDIISKADISDATGSWYIRSTSVCLEQNIYQIWLEK